MPGVVRARLPMVLLFALAACGSDPGPVDAGVALDAGIDAGSEDDAGVDAGGAPRLPVPALRWPPRGHHTGSVRARDPGLADPPLRPRFVWTPVAGAVDYRLQLAPCPRGAVATCTFDDLVVDIRVPGTETGDALAHRLEEALPAATTAPVGRRFVWRMAACDADGCGFFGAVRYLEVGSLPDDYDGDGFSDPVVSALSGGGGRVQVFRGGVDVGAVQGTRTQLDGAVPDPSQYGATPTSGDFDGDGFADLAVGAPTVASESGGADRVGRVFLYLGGPAAFEAGQAPDAALAPPLEVEDGFYGTLGPCGDLNGDGFDDLVVGQRGGGTGTGAVHVYLGGVAGIGGSPARSYTYPEGLEGGRFGEALDASGDFDGDGFADLLAAAPGGNRVALFRGGPDGPDPSPSGVTRFDERLTLGDGAELGHALAWVGDLDGDGFEDFAVGAPFFDAEDPEGGFVEDVGAVLLFFGARSFPEVLDGVLLPPRPGAGGGFGLAVAGRGDVTGDGFPDVLASANGTLVGEDEAVFLVPGGPDVRRGASLESGVQDVVRGAAPMDDPNRDLGAALRILGDVDGDGIGDAAIGVPGLDREGLLDAGAVALHLGSAVTVEAARLVEPAARDARFGADLH
jgi:hypothetical protein